MIRWRHRKAGSLEYIAASHGRYTAVIVQEGVAWGYRVEWSGGGTEGQRPTLREAKSAVVAILLQ